MASHPAQTLFDIRRDARGIDPCAQVRGFREVQVEKYIRSREQSGDAFPSYGEIMRDLDFYDRAGAYRVVKRLKEKGSINNNT